MSRFRLFSALSLCAAALFSMPTASAQAKIGLVNFRTAIADTAEAKKVQADLTSKYKSRQDALDKATRDYTDLQTQYQNSQGKLSAAGQADLESKMNRKQREHDNLADDLQTDYQKDMDDINQRLGSRMIEVVKKIMDEKGFDAIFDTVGAVAYKTGTGVDLTKDATSAYDKAYPMKP
ncbi:MAG TPA: OmpH family outer membrane protein [Bryobacteraceae bacterium]|jgi:Skp family chaperone for outer membrane proteins